MAKFVITTSRHITQKGRNYPEYVNASPSNHTEVELDDDFVKSEHDKTIYPVDNAPGKPRKSHIATNVVPPLKSHESGAPGNKPHSETEAYKNSQINVNPDSPNNPNGPNNPNRGTDVNGNPPNEADPTNPANKASTDNPANPAYKAEDARKHAEHVKTGKSGRASDK